MVISDVLLDGKVDGNFHLGHVVLDCFKRRRPDDICQIEAATGEYETYDSVLSRSIRLARCLRRAGYQPGDVVTVGGRNHLDIHIPFYAAAFNGLPVAGVDPLFKYEEIKAMLYISKPKISFCEQETYDIYAKVSKELGLGVKIITFSGGECTMSKFMDTYVGEETDEFKPAFFDTEKVYAWLISTSGTTGVPKLAALKHEPVIKMFKKSISGGMFGSVADGVQKRGFNLSPPQWWSGYYNTFGYLLTNTCLVQTTKMDSLDHIIDVFNKYKPSVILTSPSLLARILKIDKPCDLTCLEIIVIGGAKVYTELLTGLKNRARPDADIRHVYGQTESASFILGLASSNGPIAGMSAVDSSHEIKLIDVDNGREITEPNQPGELWFKGLCFTEYYNNPIETAKAFADDGWIPSGDLFSRDENGLYYFLERLKMLIKYRNVQVMPPEIEEVILTHPGVLDVGVTGVPHMEDSQHPVACIVRREGCNVTAQEIKDLVAEKLSDSKQLRGGVVFLTELPTTSTGKVNRSKLRDIALEANRE